MFPLSLLFALSYVKVARSSSGSVDRAIFSRLPSPGPLSRDEHRLQGRVQINIKLNYNDSVYRGAAHSRALHRQPLFAMDGTNPATARLVIFYAMYINTAMPRGRVLVCTCSLVAAFTPLSQDAGDTSTCFSRRRDANI